jgi:hypothetical protein
MTSQRAGWLGIAACAGGLLVGCSDDGGRASDTLTGGMTSTLPSNPSGATDTPTGGDPSGNPSSDTDPQETQGTQGTQGTNPTGDTGINDDTGTSQGTVTDTDATSQGTSITDTGDGVLDISPDNAVIEIVDGAIVNQDYTVTYDGQDVTADVVWSFDQPPIGTMGQVTFMPTGNVAGIGVLKATYGPAQDMTNVTVIIKKTIDPMGIGPFDGGVGPDPSMQIVYPYDNTVWPLKVASPIVQWNGAQNGDQYKLHLKEQFYEYTVYFQTDNPTRHLINEMEWLGFSESGQGANNDPVTFELQRKSGGQVYNPVTQTWKIAQARLPGRVYYWELPSQCGNGNGRVLSIKPQEAQPIEFFQPGQCWGCHTVSRDGRTVAAVFESGSPFPTATIDVSVEPATYGAIQPGSGLGGTFSAFNHDGTKVVQSNDPANAVNSGLVIFDTMTAQVLNPNAMGNGCGEPAWSPDGLMIAATCGYPNGGWTFDQNNAELRIGQVQPDGFTVANITTLVPQNNGEPGRPAYPNFSPGNDWLIYGRPTSGSRSTGNGKLYMTSVDGQHNIRLDVASGDNRSFNPTFAPLRAGGYYWVVFMSRRDYGNTLVGANRQQLWMTAITDPPESMLDPSNPAFYVRGQEDCALSENAYFAPDPCNDDPQAGCESGIDCCSGHCIQMGEVKQCGEKGPCSEAGNACESDADCCEPGTPCVDGYCQEIFPG